MMNWGEKLEKLVFLERRVQEESTTKNYLIWINICREIKRQNEKKKFNHKEKEIH